MTDHEHNSTSAGNTGKTPEKAKAPKDPGTALISTGKTPEKAKASKNSGNAPAGSDKAPEKANASKASGTVPKDNGKVSDKAKASKASGTAPANAGKAPAADTPKASVNTPVNSGKVQDKAKAPKASGNAYTKTGKAPGPVKASKVSPSVPGIPGKTPEAKKPNAAAPVSSGKTTVVSTASEVTAAAPANAGKAADTRTAKVSGTASVSRDKVSSETRTSRDSSGYTPVRNTTPAKPPKSGKSGLLIGILIAAVVVIILGIVLYNKFFVPREIHVSETALQLEVNDVAKLTYTVLPQSADNLEVAWASSDPGVATVDEFGAVTAVSGGQCIIAVATGNNKTDTCVVTVNDLKQVQKESLETIVKYVDSQEPSAASPTTDADAKTSADSQVTNADSEGTSADSQAVNADSQETAAEGEYRLLGVKDIDNTHSFLIGAEGEDLILVYRTVEELEDLGVDAQYTTYVRMKPENTETAEVVQENNLVLYGFPISMSANGVINLSSYQYGDKVDLSDITSTVDELDAATALQEQADIGTAICVHEFASFLNDQAFDFGITDFGLENYQEPDDLDAVKEPEKEEAAVSEEAAAETEEAAASQEAAAETEEAAASQEAAAETEEAAASVEAAAETEEAAAPENADSTASGAESATSTEAAAESAPAETSSAFSEFPKAGPTSSAVSFATDSLAKAG